MQTDNHLNLMRGTARKPILMVTFAYLETPSTSPGYVCLGNYNNRPPQFLSGAHRYF